MSCDGGAIEAASPFEVWGIRCENGVLRRLRAAASYNLEARLYSLDQGSL